MLEALRGRQHRRALGELADSALERLIPETALHRAGGDEACGDLLVRRSGVRGRLRRIDKDEHEGRDELGDPTRVAALRFRHVPATTTALRGGGASALAATGHGPGGV